MPGALRSLTSRSERHEDTSEQARNFHFAVTWIELFAHLNLIESAGPRPKAETSVVSPRRDAEAAWEMVVPKMIRNGDGNFTPAEKGRRQLL
jgi:hypothetical protein